jgi:hypothetical protein
MAEEAVKERDVSSGLLCVCVCVCVEGYHVPVHIGVFQVVDSCVERKVAHEAEHRVVLPE